MLEKVISILQRDMRARTEIVNDKTGGVTDEFKVEQAGVVELLLQAIDVLKSADFQALDRQQKQPTIELDDLENILAVHLSGTDAMCMKLCDLKAGIMKAVRMHLRHQACL